MGRTNKSSQISRASRASQISQISQRVREANEAYFNGEPIMDDDEYDELFDELARLDPRDPLVTGSLVGAHPAHTIDPYGAEERLGKSGKKGDTGRKDGPDNKNGGVVELPYTMGSLNKIKDDDKSSLERWLSSYPSSDYLVMDKLDGVSAMLVVGSTSSTSTSVSHSLGPSNGSHLDGERRLYTRGDGRQGRDISHLISYLDLGRLTLRSTSIEQQQQKQKQKHNENRNVNKNGTERERKREREQKQRIDDDGDANEEENGGHEEGGNVEFAVRGELVIPKTAYMRHLSNRGPARNLVSGVVNAKLSDLSVLRHVRFVPYEVVEPRGLPIRQQMDVLKSMYADQKKQKKKQSEDDNADADGTVVFHTDVPLSRMNRENLRALLEERRETSPFYVDGLVLAQDTTLSSSSSSSATVAAFLRRSKKGVKGLKGSREDDKTESSNGERGGKGGRSLNPGNIVAFKSRAKANVAEARVADVEWSVSKDGLLKPVVIFEEPVTLCGASIEKATGFNANFIEENGVGPGAIVSVTRSGDVIPHIAEVMQASDLPPRMPDPSLWNWEWTPTHVDARVTSPTEHSTAELQIRLLTHFLKEIGVKGVSEHTVRKLHWSRIDTPGKLLHTSFERLKDVDGFGPSTTDLVWSELRRVAPVDKDTDMAVIHDCIALMKASNAFGPGFGTQRLKAILATDPGAKVAGMMLLVVNGKEGDKPGVVTHHKTSTSSFEDLPNAEELASSVRGVNHSTAASFLEGSQKFRDFLLDNNIRVPTATAEALTGP